MDLQGVDFSDSSYPMIIYSDSSDPIFNSKVTIGFLKHIKKLHSITKISNFLSIVENVKTSLPNFFEILLKFMTDQNFEGHLQPLHPTPLHPGSYTTEHVSFLEHF